MFDGGGGSNVFLLLKFKLQKRELIVEIITTDKVVKVVIKVMLLVNMG
jgi:hypothetical protein